jgi:hypothetical protein
MAEDGAKMIWRFGRFCSALVIVVGLTACTTINQTGKQNNACANNASCSQETTARSTPTPDCLARTLNITPKIVSDPTSAVRAHENEGVYELAVSGYAWAGIFIEPPVSGCAYNINFDATLYPDPSLTGPRTGYGYGFGACDTWSGTEPRGFEVQYSVYQDQNDKLWGSPGWIPLGYPNDLTPVSLSPDFNTHAWSLDVRDNTLNFTEDEGVSAGPFSLTNVDAKDYEASLLPANCNKAGVFLRVFNTKVIFSNFSANELAS